MFGDLSITATWVLRFAGLGAAIWVLVALLPWLVLRNQPHRSWFQRSVLAGNLFAITVSLISVVVLREADEEVSAIQVQQFGEGVLAETTAVGEPVNILLVGIDQAAGLSPDDPVLFARDPGSDLSDTIMILRIIPSDDQAHLLSFPRDLWVPIAEDQGNWKINEAMKIGGPELLIKTIQQNFGIEIHHYIQVNFLGFQNVVQAAGGVPMYLTNPIRDETTGLYIEDVGPLGNCVTLAPDQALAFVRSRNFEYYDQATQRWIKDGTSDLGRISRQQLFIRLAVERAINQGARDLGRMQDFLEAGQDHVVLDEHLTVGDLLDLGGQLAEFDADHLRTYQLPVEPGEVGNASVLFLLEEDAQDELNVFRGVSNSIPTFEAIRINVRNGSGRPGEATVVAQELQALNMTVASASDADRFAYPRSVIRYRESDALIAVFVAALFPTDVQFEVVESLESGATIEVVTGADYTGLLSFGNARPVAEIEAQLPATTTSTTSTTTTTSTPPSDPGIPAPTTTVLGAVPEQRESCT